MESKVKLVIFDLDGTLVDTTMQGMYDIRVDFIWMKLTPRPGYKELLAYCFDHYDVGFWTAAGRSYANNVLKLILTDEQLSKIKFLKCGENCPKLPLVEMRGEFNQDYIVYKPLHRIWRTSWAKQRGWNCHNTLIIEDSPSTCIKNYGNAIYVPSFEIARRLPMEYDKFDITSKLIKYINWFAINGCIRSTEKRRWLDRIDGLE